MKLNIGNQNFEADVVDMRIRRVDHGKHHKYHLMRGVRASTPDDVTMSIDSLPEYSAPYFYRLHDGAIFCFGASSHATLEQAYQECLKCTDPDHGTDGHTKHIIKVEEAKTTQGQVNLAGWNVDVMCKTAQAVQPADAPVMFANAGFADSFTNRNYRKLHRKEAVVRPSFTAAQVERHRTMCGGQHCDASPALWLWQQDDETWVAFDRRMCAALEAGWHIRERVTAWQMEALVVNLASMTMSSAAGNSRHVCHCDERLEFNYLLQERDAHITQQRVTMQTCNTPSLFFDRTKNTVS